MDMHIHLRPNRRRRSLGRQLSQSLVACASIKGAQGLFGYAVAGKNIHIWEFISVFYQRLMATHYSIKRTSDKLISSQQLNELGLAC